MLKLSPVASYSGDKSLQQGKAKVPKISTSTLLNKRNATPFKTTVADLNLISINNNINTNEGVNINNTSEIRTLIEFRDDANVLNEKHIYVSYEPNCNFQEKKFLVDLIRQLKENSLNNDLWFDKDEVTVGSPSWTVSRLGAVDNSLSSILFITPNYFDNQLNVLESEAIYDLKCSNSQYFLVVIVINFKMYNKKFNSNKTKKSKVHQSSLLQPLIEKSDILIDFNEKTLLQLSLSEKISHCVGCLTVPLEKLENIKSPVRKRTASSVRTYCSFGKNDVPNTDMVIAYEYSRPKTPAPYLGCHNCIQKGFKCNKCIRLFKYKKFINLNTIDVQYLLEDIKLDEFYRMNFAHLGVDGFMLMSCTEDDLIHVFDMDNKALRKRLKNAITGDQF
jgi:hypothetical protein